MGLPEDLVDQLNDRISTRRLRPDDPLFATRQGTPITWNTFGTRVWLAAVKASGVDYDVRVHDLHHAHASWVLAGGSDLKPVLDRGWATPRSPPPRNTSTASRRRRQEPRRPEQGPRRTGERGAAVTPPTPTPPRPAHGDNS